MLTNLDQIFLKKITPEQFAATMNATIGQMSTATTTRAANGSSEHGRTTAPDGPCTGRRLAGVPALVFFMLFAIIPLLGVLFLSFTSWDGIGRDQAGRAVQLDHRPGRSRH